MGFQNILVLLILVVATLAATECDKGWTPYKDELCVKVLANDLVSHEEAQKICSTETGATPVMVKEPDYQEFLSSLTNGLYDNLWLGAKYDYNFGEFRWIDNEPFNYSHWADGFPRNDIDTELCVQFRPPNAKKNAEAGWEDVACQRRNLAICQKTLEWTLKDAVNEIIKLRKGLQAANREIMAVNNRVVPVGSIYIEYFNQPSPTLLWPELRWENITEAYAGLFFRASGADGEKWGVTQEACAPRVTQMQYNWSTTSYDWNVAVPSNGWSQHVLAGVYNTAWDWIEGLRLFSEDCNVRPRNQAIRIWKRVE